MTRKPCGCKMPKGHLRGRFPSTIRFANPCCSNCKGVLSLRQRVNLINHRLATYAIEGERRVKNKG
jgi:hypothetical protein